MRRSNEQSLKEVLSQMMKDFNLQDRMNQVRLINSWERVMGKTIAKHTKDIYISGKKLILTIDSPALKNELVMGRSKIVEVMNREIGAEVITDVEIR